MSKALPASCAAGVVLTGGIPVPSAEILSSGVGPSSGVLILDEDEAFYIPDTTPDLDTTLAQIITALTQVSQALAQTVLALNVLDNKPLGALPPVPAVTANSTAITAAAAAVTAATAQLTVLKAILK